MPARGRRVEHTLPRVLDRAVLDGRIDRRCPVPPPGSVRRDFRGDVVPAEGLLDHATAGLPAESSDCGSHGIPGPRLARRARQQHRQQRHDSASPERHKGVFDIPCTGPAQPRAKLGRNSSVPPCAAPRGRLRSEPRRGSRHPTRPADLSRVVRAPPDGAAG